MAKVLQIINRLNLGGPTFNAAYLSRFMGPEFDTMLVSGMKDDTEASSQFILDDLGIQPHYIESMHREISPGQDRKAYAELRELIRQFKPDIIHTHASKAGALGRLAGKAEKVPVVIHTFHGHVFHSYFGPLKTRFYLEVERFLARRSDAIIAISRQQKIELAEQYRVCDPQKIEIVHLGVDFTRFKENRESKRADFRKKYNLREEEIAIGIIGRLVPIKQHYFFLRVLQNLLSRHPNVRAFIVGDGESRTAIEAEARALGIPYATEHEERTDQPLTFTSWIREVDEVVAGLDIIALTSLNEGTPVSLIEAQAGGKPIVSTRVGGVEDVVQPGETALLTSKTDISGFVRATEQLIMNPVLRQKMGEKGCDFVNRRFGIEKMVEETASLYDRHLVANT